MSWLPIDTKTGHEFELLAQFEQSLKPFQEFSKFEKDRGEAEIKIVDWISIFNENMNSKEKNEISNLIIEMDLKYDNLEMDLILAMITHESALTWNPKIVSPVGAIGLMQIMPATGYVVAGWEGLNHFATVDLFSPIINIRLGCRYLSHLIDTEINLEAALAHYNGGPRQARLYSDGDSLLCAETRGYVPAIKLWQSNLQNN